MKVKKKQKHLEEEERNSDVANSCGDRDMENKDPETEDKPPDDLGFVSVLDLLQRYLWMLSTMSRDQLRDLIDQGIFCKILLFAEIN